MTKLFIPAIGDRLTLIKDWTFTLYLSLRTGVCKISNMSYVDGNAE